MLSGRRLDLLDPAAVDVEVADIALGLSRVARWNGQTRGPHGFSVAQHSLLVLDLVEAAAPRLPAAARLAALLHDAGEYVTSDLITPFKAAIGPEYKALECRIATAIRLRFGLPATLPAGWDAAIKRADRIAAFLEAVELAGFAEAEARRVLGFRIRAPAMPALDPWPAEVARTAFLDRFAMLCPPSGRQVPASPAGPKWPARNE